MALPRALRLPRGSSSGLLLLGAAGVIGIGIAKSMYTGEERSWLVCVCVSRVMNDLAIDVCHVL